MQHADIALCETGMQLQCQRMELYQSNQFTDQTPMEKSWLCDELEMRSRAFQEDRANYCQQNEELRRTCCARARQLRTDELSTQKEESKSFVNRLVVQIHELQDKVNSLNGAKEFYDPEPASTSGLSHVPSQHVRSPSPRGMMSDSCLQPDIRNSLGTSRHVFQNLPPRGEPSSAIFENSTGKIAEQREVLRQEPPNHAIPTPRFTRMFSTWRPLYRAGGGNPQNCMMENPRNQISDLHFE